MNKCLLLLFLIHAPFLHLNAQSSYQLSKTNSVNAASYQILPDFGYSFKQILNDTTLVYRSNFLKLAEHESYWIKMQISNPYPDDEHYVINLSLPLNYTLYAFDPHKKIWIKRQAGYATANRYRQSGKVAVGFPKHTTSTIYLKIDLYEFPRDAYILNPTVVLEKAEGLENGENLLRYHMLVCSIVLLSFVGYNLYLYIFLKDKAYLYFMWTQVGAIIFLLGTRQYYNILFTRRVYNAMIVSENSIYIYDLNKLFQHLGVFIIIFGITQFTRVYLSARELLPGFDKALRYSLCGYAAFEAIPSLVTISGLFYLDYYTIVPDNLYIQFSLILVLITGAAAARKHIPSAKYLLFANILPITLVLATSLYSMIVDRVNPVLPELAIFSQILTFGVALVARVKYVTAELNEKQLESLKLAAEIRETAYEHMLAEQKTRQVMAMVENERNENNRLRSNLEIKQRELVGNHIYIHKKNALLSDLAKQVEDIDFRHPDLKSDSLTSIQFSLKDNEHLNANWDSFKLHFEQVNPKFFDDLKAKHPALTTNDLRLKAYLHINLSTKEIATLLNIAPTSVKQAKSRLNKKMSGDY